MKWLFLLLPLVGCTQTPLGADPTPRPFQEEAEQYVRQYMVGEMQMTDLILDYPTSIYWREPECQDGEGMYVGGVCVGGWMWDCSSIVVVDVGCIGASSLTHELGHCFRFAQGIGGDPRHWDKYFWGEIEVIKSDLRVLEECDE